MSNLDKYLKGSPDKYEFIVKNDATQLVFDVMDSVYNQSKDENGESATYVRAEDFERLRDEAADEVENYLLEEAMKSAASNKIKQKLSASSTVKEPVKTSSATLSNSLAQQTSVQSERSLIEEDSKRRMAAMLKYRE